MPRSIFSIVKEVLDENYNEIQGDIVERDLLIKDALQQIGKEYRSLGEKAPEIDYKNPTIRFAYIYKYVTCHANIVNSIICENRLLGNLFQKENISLSCVGGGPGSDFLGVIKYLVERQSKTFLQCFMLDREEAWNECWCDVDSKCGCDFRVSTNFQSVNVCDSDSWVEKSKYLGADLFTFVYFISEVYRDREEAEPFFKNLFCRAKPNALILIVDNDTSIFKDWIDDLMNSNGIAILNKEKEFFGMPTDEQKVELEPYLSKFGPPKIQAKIFIRIGKKE